uniref:IGFBP N-terminal domain-containing protein n=1 Tax=Oryctolagus cuniculus TaxID=9986 RepID=A0A5F9DVN1_RABIT
MRRTSQTHLLAFFLCLLPQVSTQLCPTPCACPWPPPRCPPGVPLVPDGCGCCRVCARRLGEPCDHLHVCDSSQGLVCQPGTGPGGRGATCLCPRLLSESWVCCFSMTLNTRPFSPPFSALASSDALGRVLQPCPGTLGAVLSMVDSLSPAHWKPAAALPVTKL